MREGRAGEAGTVEVGDLVTPERVAEVVAARIALLLADGWIESIVPP